MQNNEKTATGLDEKIAGLLCYAGWWVSGIIFLIIEPENRFIKFHAIQSILSFGFISVVLSIIGWLPGVGVFFSMIIGLGGLALWIAMMFMAYQGTRYKLPIAGNMAERYSEGKPA